MAIANITGNILTDSGVVTSSLLPLTGGTLTGALNGTSATFSGEIKSGDTITLGAAAVGGFWTWGSTISYLVAGTGKALNLNPNGTSGNVGISIATSGNVGIGTSSPSALLTLLKDSNIGINTSDGSDNGYLALCGAGGDGSARGGHIYLSGNERGADAGTVVLSAGNVADGAIMFRTGAGTERMRIRSDGGVAINSTSNDARLLVNGGGGSETVFQINDVGARRVFCIPSQFYGYILAVSVVSNGGKAISFGNASAEQGSIVVNASSTSYNTTSDYRLKEDLKDFDGLDILSKIKFYDFKWKVDNERTTGVIAHELKEVVPYAVNGEKDAIGKDDKPSYQGVDYSKLISIMGKAIQELSSKVSALENKS